MSDGVGSSGRPADASAFSSEDALPVRARPLRAELWALSKPGIVRMCLVTTAGGLWLATSQQPVDGGVAWLTVICTLVGSALAVASANACNMIWERETDALMERTKHRPLPAGRLSVAAATWFAGATGVASLGVLAWGVNLLTAGLAAFAIASYVGVYTPLKYKTPAALIVGAVPGAIPPLLGWTAVSGAFDPPGLAIFAILLVWQIPHFIAISLFRASEYEKAGIQVLPLVRGPLQAKLHAAAWSVGLIPISMSLTPLHLTGTVYFVVALVLSVAYFVYALVGFAPSSGDRWAKRYFFASLIYLPALTLGLILDLTLQGMGAP